ncbi:glutaredoxin family protein [uncultured Ramlibacter sp.]|uniref:glutaredoxin family protein n=1 Tax=uncultured Ramlibacter sp. TaxID=260755 RepID=UPI002608E750|nr:glutaredoxin family protein [uncultured Ramlibacter sp.]
MPVTRPLLAASLAGLMAAILAPAVHAQVYRITGPDGRVTFSDKPPPEPSAKNAAAAPTVPMQGAGSGNATAALPFELRQVAAKYPVTLYTGPNCGPCGSGRALLASRGIPFSEKLVASNEDIDALKRLSGASSLPFVTIGGQQLKGYSEVEWSQFLDAAGYPKTSQLPSSYRQPAASPLVAVQQQAPAPAAQAAPPPAPAPVAAPPAAAGPSPSNPTGIRF